MVHILSIIPCSQYNPKYQSSVEFWDWMGEKRIGAFYTINTKTGPVDYFIEYKTGFCFTPIKEVAYWRYKN